MFYYKILRYNLRLKNVLKRHYNDVQFDDLPEVSPALIKKVLKSHNIGFQEGYTCFLTQCSCGKNGAKTGSATTYINKTTGMFMCSFCKLHGSWNEWELQFCTNKRNGKEADLKENEKLKESLLNIQQETTPLLSLPEEHLKNVFKSFELPVISSTSFSTLDVRLNHTKNTIYFPLQNVESEIVGYRTLNKTNEESLVPSSPFYGGLLTAKAPKSKDSAILIPSIADFLVLLNAKVPNNLVCLPNKFHSLAQYYLPNFERFKKLILWFGNDINSWNSARDFARKLGDKRCSFIRPTEDQKLPSQNPKQDFKAIIGAAQPVWHKSITTFASLRMDVLSDLQNIDKVQGIKWKRYPSLNKILKGHRRGELTVLTGPTGSGKTTFISEYSLDLALQGVNTLWGSFEIRNARLARTMLQQMALVPLEENLQDFNKFADKFEKLPIYFMTFHGQQTIKIVMEAVEHAAYIYDIAHVIIDNVQFMMGITEEQKHMDRFWKQDAIIAAFRTFATRKNCHVTLVIHPRKEREDEDLTTSSIFGGAKASQEADNVLLIQDKRLASLRGKKYLQVAKNRYSGDVGVMPLDFDKSTLSFMNKKPRKSSEDKVKPEDTNDSIKT